MTAGNARTFATLIVIVPGLFACAMGLSEISFSPAPRPPEGSGLVYLFRSDRAEAGFSTPVARIDGKAVLALRAEEYTAIHLPAGRHMASLEPEGLPKISPALDLEFVVQSGQVGALSLGIIGSRPERARITIETKQGDMNIPPGYPSAAAEGPYAWRYIPAIEASPLYAQLRQRRFRAATAAEFVPR